MSNAQHTSGPWVAEETGEKNQRKICPVDGIGVALVFGDTESECEANARLIASAPEMLVALEDLLTQPDGDENWAKARAAINKAKGE